MFCFTQPPQAPQFFRVTAPAAARRAHPVQRSSFQGLRGNRDACRPGRGVVGPSYGSFASGQARKLIPSAGPPLPTEPASLGFGGGPIGRADTIRPYRLGSWQTVGGPSLPIPGRGYIWSVSNRMVTGPSFWLYTCMSAPNSPCSTRKPRAAHSAMNFS